MRPTTPTSPPDDSTAQRPVYGVWCALALLFGLIPPAESLSEFLLAAGPVVQDDARQFLFWMARWRDPGLFPGDVIAEYFRQATPLGFAGLYRALDFLGLDPWMANRLIPLVLGPVAAHFAFRLTFLLAPSAGVAFAGSALTSFFAWLIDDMASGTPRAFALPMLLAFLTFLAGRRAVAVAVAAALAGLFYPLAALIIGGVAVSCLLAFGPAGRIGPVRDAKTLRAALAGVFGTAVGLLPFVYGMGGGALTVAEAAALPAFQPGGRSAFFLDRADWFYLCGERSGLLPVEWGCHSLYGIGSVLAPGLAVLLLILGFVPAAILAWRGLRAPEDDTPSAFASTLPARLLSVALILFGAAHLLLFSLHLPARYGQLPLRAVAWVALAAVAGPPFVRWISRRSGSAGRRAAQATALVAALLLVPFPFVPRSMYVAVDHPHIYTAISELPTDTVIASLAREADSIPSLARRSVFVAREYLIPYSQAYGTALRDRMAGLIDAVYTRDPVALRDFALENGIGAFVIEAGTFSATYLDAAWWRHDFPEAWSMVRDRMAGGGPFALASIAENCGAVRTLPLYRIIPVSCLSGP